MNTSKIIKAYIGAGTYSTTEPITQGDYGYILQIEGAELPPIYRVDFSNDRHTRMKPMHSVNFSDRQDRQSILPI